MLARSAWLNAQARSAWEFCKAKLHSIDPLAGAYAKRYFRTLRHKVKAASGMLARSAWKPAGGWVEIVGGSDNNETGLCFKNRLLFHKL
jgi:hypothetical protein